MDLKETVSLMTSEDYKERFAAEYLQLKERYTRLKRYVTRIRANAMVGLNEPPHDCPVHLLGQQLQQMDDYLRTLELRAVVEKIDLEAYEYTSHALKVNG